MRKSVFGTLSFLLLAFPLAYGQSQSQESVAEAARKAREQKKSQPKSAKVITNDNLSAVPGKINVVGSEPAPEAAAKPEEAKAAPAGEKAAKGPEEKGEAYWRKRFAEARGKLRVAEKELDILQRELNLTNQQYYSDPNKALREQYDRKDINNLAKTVADKKQEVDQLKQALSDLEDELRRAGGEPAWARE
jgi:chromosome segregation ATPase